MKNGLGAGDGYRMHCKLSRAFGLTEENAGCTVFTLKLPYIYAIPNSVSNYAGHATLLVDNRMGRDDDVQLCEGICNFGASCHSLTCVTFRFHGSVFTVDKWTDVNLFMASVNFRGWGRFWQLRPKLPSDHLLFSVFTLSGHKFRDCCRMHIWKGKLFLFPPVSAPAVLNVT